MSPKPLSLCSDGENEPHWVRSVYSNICPPKSSCENRPPHPWLQGGGGQECASSWRRMSAASAVGTNQRMRRSTGCGCLWYLAIWGPPASLGLRWRHGGFLRSAGELHMAEIKGVAGCTVLLYFQALLLIRKQDQRQY